MFYFAKFRRRNFTYLALWLVSRPVFTNIKWSVDDVGFRKFISNVKVLTCTFERKISKFLFGNKISKLFLTWKGPKNKSVVYSAAFWWTRPNPAFVWRPSGTANWRTSSKHNIVRDSGPMAPWYIKTRRHPQNRKYITYRNAIRGGLRHGHMQHA